MVAFNFRLSSGMAPLSVADWRAAARRRLPDMAWNYIEGGSDDLVTAQDNIVAFLQHRLRTRVLTGTAKPRLAATMAGTQVSMPLALAPVGATGMAHWSGDVAAARAAETAGTRAVLSTAASYRIEEVAQATTESHWFQIYPIGGRARVGELMARAKAAGYSALFVTVDVPTLGNREGERRWHFQLPWTVTPYRAWHLLRHPRWVWEALRYKRMAAIYFIETEQQQTSLAADAMAQVAQSGARLASQLQADLTWDDVKWMRDTWKGRFYVKGILDANDAAKAVDELGADGVVVSNHGGRQLDRCLPSIDALAPVAARIGHRAEVYLDGGVRRGTDVIIALCLGARGVFIGRPFVYGLAAGGEAGVRGVLDIMREEIERDLILMGCPSVQTLNPAWLAARPATSGALEPFSETDGRAPSRRDV